MKKEECGSNWKKDVVAYFRYCLAICIDTVRVDSIRIETALRRMIINMNEVQM
jgi:hypothetical protein